MTKSKDEVIDAIVKRILEREGDITQNPGEAFVTRWGQTPGWLTRWRLPVPKSRDEAAMNYRSWIEATNLDALCDEDDELPDIVIDYAVHNGEGAAIRTLQTALGVKADGILGPKTEARLASINRRALAHGVIAVRIQVDAGLIQDKPEKYLKFARGWAKRLAEQIVSLA